MKNFFERLKVEPQKLIAVNSLIRAVYRLPTKRVNLEACTGRLFTDQGPVFFQTRASGKIQELIRGFCCQGDFTSEEILDVLTEL